MAKIQMGDIKPTKKTITTKKDEPILKIKQIGSKSEPLKEYNEYASVPKELKPQNKTKKRIIITIVMLIIIWVILYFFSSIQITIIPHIKTKTRPCGPVILSQSSLEIIVAKVVIPCHSARDDNKKISRNNKQQRLENFDFIK